MQSRPQLVHLRPADARRVPGRSGRGFTDELAIWPPGASFETGAFDARISTSSVDAPGPFAPSAGFDRLLVVTGGDGLVLDHGSRAGSARVEPFVPYAFPGDWPTSAKLVDGPVADFDVLVRRGRLEADVTLLRVHEGGATREALMACDAFVHVIWGSGSAGLHGGLAPSVLATGESLWIRGVHGVGSLVLSGRDGGCAALLVRIRAAAAS